MSSSRRPADETVDWKSSVPFVAVHFLPLLAIFTGVTATSLVLFAVLYLGRMFCITAGYHRYFAHRAYRLARVPQFLLAFGGLMAAQKGPLWWAGNHRDHHRYTDTERDPHTPQKGFWWSHIGWVMCGKYSVRGNNDRIRDFASYPELRFLDKQDWIGPWTAGVFAYVVGGWSGLVLGFFGSTVLLWHATFSVNSFSHVLGSRRYRTPDTSKNNPVVAVMTLGEGWHNNHHHHPACARQGFKWWEIDVTYYVLRGLAAVGIVRDLKQPTAAAKVARLVKDAPEPEAEPERELVNA